MLMRARSPTSSPICVWYRKSVTSTTSRGVTNSSALEPEKPVRYRMLGKLVTSRPSTWAAVNPSTSADRRRERESGTSRQRASRQHARESAQGQLIPVRAESDHRPDGGGREHRVPSLGFARVHVRDVDFHEGHHDRGQGVAKREARV